MEVKDTNFYWNGFDEIFTKGVRIMTTQEMNTNITNTNEPAEKKTNKKKAIGIVAVAAVTVAAVIIAMLTACGNKQPTATADEVVIGTSVQTVTQVVTDAQGNTHIEEETKVVEVKQTQPSEKSEKATEANAENMAKTDSKQNNGGQSNNNSNGNSNNNNAGNGQTSKSNGSSSGSTNKPASNSGSSSSSQSKPSSGSGSSSSSKPEPAPTPQPATKDPHEGKTWHEAEYKTEKVWVVDEEGYTWQKPIVEGQWRTICNICGADITEDVTGHDKTYHLPYGDDFSYSDKWIEQITGYETIKVPEKGHYETKTTLVREAGWY